MGKIVYIMGKSSTGKDTLFKKLVSNNRFNYKMIVPYTTRPIREGEIEGKSYFFLDEAGYLELKNAGKIIEERSYNTVHGIWRYFTADDGQINDIDNFITIGTLESYDKIRRYYGDERVIPVLIELDDGVRLQRALDREKQQEVPKYEEMCRRFLADSADFSEEKIKNVDIKVRFINNDLDECISEIETYIQGKMN